MLSAVVPTFYLKLGRILTLRNHVFLNALIPSEDIELVPSYSH